MSWVALYTTTVETLLKSESLVSNTLQLWKLCGEFVRIRSTHDQFSEFQSFDGFCFTKLFRLYVLLKSEIIFSLTSTLKSPSRIIFWESVQKSHRIDCLKWFPLCFYKTYPLLHKAKLHHLWLYSQIWTVLKNPN